MRKSEEKYLCDFTQLIRICQTKQFYGLHSIGIPPKETVKNLEYNMLSANIQFVLSSTIYQHVITIETERMKLICGNTSPIPWQQNAFHGSQPSNSMKLILYSIRSRKTFLKYIEHEEQLCTIVRHRTESLFLREPTDYVIWHLFAL